MAATPLKSVHRASLSAFVAVALVCDVSPAAMAADIIGTPKNVATAALQIASCSVTIDPENANAFPEITLEPGAASPSKPISAQVELGLHDALGGADDTRVFSIPVAKSDVPLASYPVNGNYNGLGCHIRTISFADGSVVNVQYPAGGGGAGGSSGAVLGVVGGLLLVGGIAAAAGHGGGSSSGSGPTPTPVATQIPVTPSATPTATAKPTPLPTATPTATSVPTATPLPTPSASPTAGALLVNPQSLTFLATGPSYAKSAKASESNYAGPFNVSPSSCIDANGTGNTVASIAPASTTTGTFTVTPLAPGTCSFNITDDLGDQQVLSVGVTTTGGTVQTRKPKRESTPETPSPSPTPTATPRPKH